MRSLFTLGFGLALGLIAVSGAAHAQSYPSQPIRFINGLAPGGATDVVFRTLAESLKDQFGQSVVNDNKPGANGLIAMEQVAQSKPDGYTFMVISSTVASGLLTMKDKGAVDIFDRLDFVVPVAGGPSTVIAAVKSMPDTFKEFVAKAKAAPGSIRYASSGAGAGPHLEMVLLSKRAGIEMVHLPQKGAGAMLPALANGDAHVGMITMASIAGQVKSGDLKVLAVLAPKRLKNIPDVPTLTELGYPEFETRPLWHAMLAPKGTPEPIMQTMFDAVQKALVSDRMKELYERTEVWPLPLKTRPEAMSWSKTSLDSFKKLIGEVGIDPK